MAALRRESVDITADYPNLKELIANMFETLTISEGVGLAAPQVGLNIRLAVIDLDVIADDEPQYKGFRRAYINPHIVEADDTQTDTMDEGCLSLPGIREKVTRPVRIRVQYVDENFTPHDEWVDGFLARVMQHEFDHLDAKLFIDRTSPMRRPLIKRRLQALQQGRYNCASRARSAAR